MVLAAVFVVALAGIWLGRPDPRFGPPPVSRRLARELAAHYQVEQGWAGSDLLLIGAQTALQEQIGWGAAFFLADADRRVIYHPRPDLIGRMLGPGAPSQLLPVQVRGQTVGYLGIEAGHTRRVGEPPGPVGALGRILLAVAALAGLGGITFGSLMSRSLTAPLNSLVKGARAIGTRNFSQRVEEKGSDEIIAVARAFNEMAADLERGEQLRRNLLADVAHELRTPLSVLQGNLRAILDEVYPLDQTEVARLYEQTRFLSRLVNDLHELAQAEAGQLPLNKQETDLAELVQTTVESFRPSTEAKSISLQTELPAGLPPLRIDGERLRQVLQNLLANALRHTPSGGGITVRAASEPGFIRLSVADTGEGISAEHLPYIFDRFYRADHARSRDRGGAGLGLAIARAIVEAHGGQISTASPGAPGQGSVFTIQLPKDER
jgi:signal transduction histidine kinase